MKPPKATKVPYKSSIHNINRIDNYHWMRLSDKQKTSKLKDKQTKNVLDYIDKENQYTKNMLKKTEKLQKSLYKEMVGRIKKDDSSIPYEYNGYWYITKFKKGKEYPYYIRKKGTLKAKEELLLDVNKLANGQKYFDLNFDPDYISLDNKWLIYTVDTEGRRIYKIFIMNIKSRKVLNYNIPNVESCVVWANDNKTIFYLQKNMDTLIGEKLYQHTINEKISNDKLIYFEKDKTFDNYIYKTKSNKYIVLAHHSTLASDIQLIDANHPMKKLKRFTPRLKKHLYTIGHINNKFYIVSNWNAKNYRLLVTNENQTNRKYWKEILPNRKSIFLDDHFECFNNFIVLQERIKGLPNIRILNLKNNQSYYIKFNEDAYTCSIAGRNLDFDTNKIKYTYTSLISPFSTYEFNMETKKQKLLKKQQIVGGYDKSKYISKRIFAKSRDGKNVPISLVYNKEKFKNSSKLLLYGYGSYGATISPYFSIPRLSLLDRGFCFAIAHVRGGKIYDESWYENGKLLNKKNTFYDFIDCAKYLIKKGYTKKEHLYAEGGSAGGLLMGAILNIDGTIFNGVTAAVPFVDVINTMLDDTIPLTTFEYDEWGNPNNKKFFDYMLSYSPYDNVEKKDYPNILITSGFFDSQVQYWEPLKWIAKLRELKTDQNILLLHMNMETGHGGTTGRFKIYKEIALEYAFLFYLENIKS